MTVQVISQSSLTMTGSEQTVGSAVQTGKTVVLQIDLNNLAPGDWVELICYTKASSGGTARAYFRQSFIDAQTGSPMYLSIPVPAPYYAEFKIVQSVGTAYRSIDFCLMSID